MLVAAPLEKWPSSECPTVGSFSTKLSSLVTKQQSKRCDTRRRSLGVGLNGSSSLIPGRSEWHRVRVEADGNLGVFG